MDSSINLIKAFHTETTRQFLALVTFHFTQYLAFLLCYMHWLTLLVAFKSLLSSDLLLSLSTLFPSSFEFFPPLLVFLLLSS